MALSPREVSSAGQWLLGNTWFWLGVCMMYAGLASLALWALGKVPVLGWSGRRQAEPIEPLENQALATTSDTVTTT